MNSAHRPSLAVTAPAASITATASTLPSLIPTLLFGQEENSPPDASVSIVQALSRRSDLDLISYTSVKVYDTSMTRMARELIQF